VKFTLSWLKEYLDTDEPLEKIADKLTMIGLEVEHIDDKAKALAPFVIAKVISAEQHPNADRLRVHGRLRPDRQWRQAAAGGLRRAECARRPHQRVLAARHLHSRQEHHALVGNIRGVESHGMLCSAAELELSDDHDGIIELPADAPVGKAYANGPGSAIR
jgi:phenylalanyl-tRNA synthetase beta chain